jgi:hypothetical protein
MANKKINWTQAKTDYIADPKLGLRDIAKKHGISYSKITKVSSEEGWVKQRNESQSNIEKKAIEEVEGTVKDLIVRHAKVARFLQAGGVTHLRTIVNHLSEHPELLKSKNPKILVSFINVLSLMIDKGLGGERELYPKQMKIEGDVEMRFGEVSDELKEAAHNALVKRITRKPRGNTKRS